MYSIYCDDICIYNDTSVDVGARLVAPTVSWEDNAAGTCTFTLPPSNAGYESLVIMHSMIVVKKFDEEIWWGRPIKEQKDFWKNRIITCEGALAFLNDIIQPQRVFEQQETWGWYDHPTVEVDPQDPYVLYFNGYTNSYLQYLIDNHNAKSNYKFTIGTNDVQKALIDEDNNDEYFEYILVRIDNKNTLECITEKLTNKEEIGGHLYVAGKNQNGEYILNYLKKPVENSNQTIEFGKNLLDYTRDYDDTTVCTVLYPRGQQEDEVADGLNSHEELVTPVPEQEYTDDDDGVTKVSLLVDPPYVVNRIGKDAYGWVEKIMDFNDAKDEEELRRKAIEWMTKHRFKDMELSVKAFDLSYMGVRYEDVKFFQNVRVISRVHGLDMMIPVLSISVPLDQPQNATYTLGKKKVASTISTYSSSVQKDVDKQADLGALSDNINKKRISENYDKTMAEIAAERQRVDQEVAAMRASIDAEIQSVQKSIGDSIATATKGRITIKQNHGGADCLVIADIPNSKVAGYDFETASDGMWVWNYEGLSFFPLGIKNRHATGGAPRLGMDRYGHIYADDISAATVTANQIKAGTLDCALVTVKDMRADWITAGTLDCKNIVVKNLIADHVMCSGTDSMPGGGSFNTYTEISAGKVWLNTGSGYSSTGVKLVATRTKYKDKYDTDQILDNNLLIKAGGQIVIDSRDNPNARFRSVKRNGEVYNPKFVVNGDTYKSGSTYFLSPISDTHHMAEISFSVRYTTEWYDWGRDPVIDDYYYKQDPTDGLLKAYYPGFRYEGLTPVYTRGMIFHPDEDNTKLGIPITKIDIGICEIDSSTMTYPGGWKYGEIYYHGVFPSVPVVTVTLQYPNESGSSSHELFGWTVYVHSVDETKFSYIACNNDAHWDYGNHQLCINWIAISSDAVDGAF